MGVYFMPEKDDSFIQSLLAWARTGKRPRPSFPRAIQFQTLSTCNARCLFCCHRHHPQEIKHGRMEDGLIRKIIAECGRHKLALGRLSPYLTNEPLLDRRLPAIIKEIKSSCGPLMKTKINTNAALLDRKMSRQILDSGLTHLWISVNGYSPETYRASMDLDFERTMANIAGFLALKKALRRKRPRVIVTTIRTRLVEKELEKASRHWSGQDVTFKIQNLDNRAGEEVTGGLRSEKDRVKPKRECDLFLKQAYIVENGDMILCCHDWRQSVKVGNVARSSIYEVWNSDRFKGLIYDYFSQKFDELEICRQCC